MQYEYVKSNKNQILEGVLLIKPKVFKDLRGEFFESWNFKEFNDVIKRKVNFVQDNFSRSSKGVLRGLHFQRHPYPQGKLIRCTNGTIFDVAVDLRIKSKTFLQWFGIELDSFNNYQIWIPEGFAHGFLTLSNKADVTYKTNQFWMPDYEESIRWNDPKIAINWPTKISSPILSEKDKAATSFDKVDLCRIFK